MAQENTSKTYIMQRKGAIIIAIIVIMIGAIAYFSTDAARNAREGVMDNAKTTADTAITVTNTANTTADNVTPSTAEAVSGFIENTTTHTRVL